MSDRQFKKGERYRVAAGARASGFARVPPPGSTVTIWTDGLDSDGDVSVQTNDSCVLWCLPEYLIPLDAERPSAVHPDAVALPEDPGEGKHWEPCAFEDWLDAAISDRATLRIGDANWSWYRAVPDAPVWPTDLGSHLMVRVEDGQVTVALREKAVWYWLLASGAVVLSAHERVETMLRPLTMSEATTHAALVKTLADLRAESAS